MQIFSSNCKGSDKTVTSYPSFESVFFIANNSIIALPSLIMITPYCNYDTDYKKEQRTQQHRFSSSGRYTLLISSRKNVFAIRPIPLALHVHGKNCHLPFPNPVNINAEKIVSTTPIHSDAVFEKSRLKLTCSRYKEIPPKKRNTESKRYPLPASPSLFNRK